MAFQFDSTTTVVRLWVHLPLEQATTSSGFRADFFVCFIYLERCVELGTIRQTAQSEKTVKKFKNFIYNML